MLQVNAAARDAQMHVHSDEDDDVMAITDPEDDVGYLPIGII